MVACPGSSFSPFSSSGCLGWELAHLLHLSLKDEAVGSEHRQAAHRLELRSLLSFTVFTLSIIIVCDECFDFPFTVMIQNFIST